MNKERIKTIPTGDFEEISNQMPNWENRFLSLVQQRKRIKYLLTMMPYFPHEVNKALDEACYYECFLDTDTRQRFLIPPSK